VPVAVSVSEYVDSFVAIVEGVRPVKLREVTGAMLTTRGLDQADTMDV